MANAKTPTIDAAIKAFVNMRDDLDARRQAFKTFEAERKEQMAKVSEFIEEYLDKQGGTSFKSESGTAFKAMKDAVSFLDFDTFITSTVKDAMTEVYGDKLTQAALARITDALLSIGPMFFLTKSLSKNSVKEYMKQHKGQAPKGVEYEQRYEIQVRRPNKKD